MKTTFPDRVTDGDDYSVEVVRNAQGIPQQLTISGKHLMTGKWQSATHDISSTGELLKAHIDALRDAGMNPKRYCRMGSVLLRVAVRDAVDEWWAERKAVLEREADELDAKIAAAIPGLAELRAACDDAERYDDEFQRMMEDESDDGARPPREPRFDAKEIRAKYPRAALYVKAEAYSCAAHWAKSKAGHEAMEILVEGGTEEAARLKLDRWMEDNGVEVD